ncbi:MAG: DNA mismatch endonuclease Vsr [Flavobacteriales bacterium]|mgnify:FL=1|nr:DNA mismatch endonuclease Vsr [Flavobacteriales bacterium]
MSTRTYLRDGRAPIPKDERTSALMSRIRNMDTAPERAMRALLAAEGIKGYRLNHATTPGRPDIAFVGRKVAVFVHGCFWHGCPHCSPQKPKSNSAWWKHKLGANKARDLRKTQALRTLGWSVTTIWECRLRATPQVQVKRVISALSRRAGDDRTSDGRSAVRTPRKTGTGPRGRRR